MKKVLIWPLLLVAVISFPLAYLKWWPKACQAAPLTVLKIDGTSYEIKDVSKSCSMFDGGKQWLELIDAKSGAETLIVQWFNLTNEYDVFVDGDKINVIITSDAKIVMKQSRVGNFDVVYHKIDVGSLSRNGEYLRWLDNPHDSDSRKWALRNSSTL